MSSNDPAASQPDYQDAIGRLQGDSRVIGSEQLMKFIDDLVRRVNDHEDRITTLEP